jgi:hypothetical protein
MNPQLFSRPNHDHAEFTPGFTAFEPIGNRREESGAARGRLATERAGANESIHGCSRLLTPIKDPLPPLGYFSGNVGVLRPLRETNRKQTGTNKKTNICMVNLTQKHNGRTENGLPEPRSLEPSIVAPSPTKSRLVQLSPTFLRKNREGGRTPAFADFAPLRAILGCHAVVTCHFSDKQVQFWAKVGT